MLVKPDIEDEKIIGCLRSDFGLHISQLTFLPLGGDLSTAVYRAAAEDQTLYFCRLKSGEFDEISIELPRFLREQGINQIISPLVTSSGRLWADVGAFRLILYPFVEGKNGFEVALAETDWAQFGAALKRIHTTDLPPALRQKMQTEDYSPRRRDAFLNILRRLEQETFSDPVTTRLVEYLLPRRATILDLLARAEQLALVLASRSLEFVLCHSDIHPGNLFIDTQGALFIIDWDYPMLAPKECDLMFVGGGQGYVGTTAQEEETRFYRYYRPAEVDPIALAYYRCERNIIDLVVECTRILSNTLNDQDRAKSYEIITWLFGPGGSVEMAYQALGKIPS